MQNAKTNMYTKIPIKMTTLMLWRAVTLWRYGSTMCVPKRTNPHQHMIVVTHPIIHTFLATSSNRQQIAAATTRAFKQLNDCLARVYQQVARPYACVCVYLLEGNTCTPPACTHHPLVHKVIKGSYSSPRIVLQWNRGAFARISRLCVGLSFTGARRRQE